MNTAVINVKVDSKLKKAVQKAAREEGLSVSSVVNLSLRKFIIKRTAMFSDDVQLELTPWAKRMLKKAEKESKEGWVSSGFTNAEEAITWLNDPHRKYQNGNTDR